MTRLIVFVAITLVSCALTAAQYDGSFNSSADLEGPWVSRDQVEECSPQQIEKLLRVLKQTKGALRLAIMDAKQGTRSKYGYTAMFKTKPGLFSNKPLEMLEKIMDMEGLPITGGPFPKKGNPPRFVCTSATTKGSDYDIRVNPFDYCWQNRVTLWASSSGFVFLCPPFWGTYPMEFPLPIGSINCLEVKNNRFEVGWRKLSDFLDYFLLREMIRLYLGKNALMPTTQPKEALAANDCVALSAKNSIRNPQSWLFYVAMIENRCLDSPDPFKPPFNLRSNDMDNAAQIE